ncbi:ATP-binding protein [Streptomyces tsukubensis]|uniref:PPM-type phosphatase domain-containing protein n=1 Tax=Streptomyces tsukubensis TaxID=83656 RepID=A0A1V4AEJ2_9ACTN|nr:ATP-binding protein [Streptomyces tsukubensis]OON82056.1 hypothetical protein B1H18_03060 [Streptomyces tsukubensis]QFR92543.1 SpoIIE family protein phosphatase [Streptomyces tsukubensis]
MTPLTSRIPIDHASAVPLAAAQARRSALECGLAGGLPDRAAVIASELAANVVNHARDGALYIQRHSAPAGEKSGAGTGGTPGAGCGIDIVAVDSGPGMAHPERCLADGYSTTGTLGHGLGAVRRLADELTVRSQVGMGTVICARLALPGTPPLHPDLGLLRLPAEGEEECGDALGVVDTEYARTAVVIDGLGHGALAAEAGDRALAVFHDDPERPPGELLTRMDRALRHTRGAAVGVLRLRSDGGAEHCGVGNVRVHTVAYDGVRQRRTGQPGVVGWNMPKPVVSTLETAPGTMAVLHSDGVDHRWAHAPSPFLLRQPPRLLGASLAHHHRTTRDDATVLVTGVTRRVSA